MVWYGLTGGSYEEAWQMAAEKSILAVVSWVLGTILSLCLGWGIWPALRGRREEGGCQRAAERYPLEPSHP